MSKTFLLLDQNPPIFRAARLDYVLPKRLRRESIKFLFLMWLISGFAAGAHFIFTRYPSDAHYPGLFKFFPDGSILVGAFLVSSGIFLLVLLFEFFYIANSRSSPVLNRDGEVYSIDYDAGSAVYHLGLFEEGSMPANVFWEAVLKAGILDMVFFRLGLAPDSMARLAELEPGELFSKEDIIHTMISLAQAKKTAAIGAAEFAEAIFVCDKKFEKFLLDRKIHREDLAGAASWVSRISRFLRDRDFFWGKPSLSRIPGMGKDFGFGYTFELDRFGRDLIGRGAPTFLGPRRNTIEAIEKLLSRNAEANVLLVADEGEGRHSILEGLALMIRQGLADPAIEHKRMVLVDFAGMTAVTKTKGNLEELIKKILSESVLAGNIILVIDDLPQAISGASALGSDLLGLLAPYIAGPKIQVIALSDRKSYHDRIEKMGKAAELFTRVEPEELSRDDGVQILEEAAAAFEYKTKTFFTYQAIRQIYDSADRYIVEGVMPQKAVALLDEAAATFGAANAKSGIRAVTAEDVEEFVMKKTGIPAQLVGEKERGLLLKLEEELRKRIVDQEEAIEQIAEALRRRRSGLGPQDRPIGSFLFLGPTGVGKTETAKALAEVYFGGEDAIMRFDMSEFQGEEGLAKLIGGRDGRDGDGYTKLPVVLKALLKLSRRKNVYNF